MYSDGVISQRLFAAMQTQQENSQSPQISPAAILVLEQIQLYRAKRDQVIALSDRDRLRDISKRRLNCVWCRPNKALISSTFPGYLARSG